MQIKTSYHQERLWFIDQFEAGNFYESSPIYHNIPFILHLERHPVHVAILERSIREVVNRHEALRTKIVTADNEPVQSIADREEFKLKILELSPPGKESENETGDRYEQALHAAIENSKGPFLLHKDILIRGTLIPIEDKKSLLVLTLHHIIADRYSLGIIAREISIYYEAFLHNSVPQLPGLPLHYADFSQWQREFPEDLTEVLFSYWLRKLRGKLQALELPTDYSRAAIHTFQEGRHPFTISETLSNKIKSMANREKTTVFVVLLAAFKILLSRYSGLEEIVVGTGVDNRQQPGTEGIVGPLANLLVLRSNITNTSSFSTIAADLNKTINDVFKYSDLPFDRLVSELRPDKDMSRTALFDVLFQYEETPPPINRIGHLEVSVVETNLGWGKYDLNMFIQSRETSFPGILVYNKDYYNHSTISRLIDHYMILLQSIFQYPMREISQLSFLTEKEKQQLLIDWNQTQANYPRDRTLHQVFAEKVEKFPHRTAVIYKDTTLTYGELNRRVNQLARYLRRHFNIQPNDLTAVLVDRSPWMIVGLLGILKAGGAYVPIDPNYPGERIHYILKDSGCKLLITVNHQKNKIKEKYDGPVVDIISHQEIDTPGEKNLEGIENLNSPGDTAYVIYTSGTTGYPKGCMVSHRNVIRLLINDKLPFKFDEHDVWIMAHSYCFDFSVWEMYGALLWGGKLIVPAWTNVQDINSFCSLIKIHRVTVLNQTPAAFYNFIEEEKKSGKKVLADHLRYICFGGDRLEPHYLKEWLEMYPLEKVQLINMFGITETTVHVTYYWLKKEDILSASQSSPIGRPLPETTLYLFDEHLNLVPIGVPGQFYVGGSGTAKGYLNNPMLTRARFFENPYKKGEIIYKTGDMGKWLADGNAEYLGRIDDQVKIRGYRIELGEIESRLLSNEHIKEAVVQVRDGKGGDKYLCAYVVYDREGPEDTPLKAEELKKYLSASLPDYMVPAYFVQLERLPLTSSGKINRQALVAPEVKTDASYQAPQNPIEKKLVELWSEVLGVETNKISIDHSFFALGGHSLNATIMTAKVHQVFQVRLPLVQVFMTPTIRELSLYIKNAQQDRYAAIEPAEKKEYYPLSSAQKGLYILQQMEFGDTTYNMPGYQLLEEGTDLEQLERAIVKLIKRHESLRTSFHMINEEPVQRIHDEVELKIEFYDLVTDKREEIQNSFIRSFDLSHAPLLRIGLVKTQKDQYLMLVDMHHIISDGISHEILVTDFMSLCRGEVLPPLRLQYKDFARWQNTPQELARLQRQQEYWLKLFEDEIPVLELPIDYAGQTVKNFAEDIVTFQIDGKPFTHMMRIAAETGVTLHMFLLATYTILLSKYSGQEDIVVGTPVSGRTHADLRNIIGMFVNMLVMRNRPKETKTFGEFLEEVRDKAIKAFDNQDYPFNELIANLKIQRVPGRHPLIDAVFSFHNTAGVPFKTNTRQPDVDDVDYKFDYEISHFDLLLHAVPHNNEVYMAFEYSGKLFKKDFIQGMANHYKDILEQAAANPEILIKDFKISHQMTVATSNILKEDQKGFNF